VMDKNWESGECIIPERMIAKPVAENVPPRLRV